jgi:prepilin-type N-terminal cleavage/methylation domain-containing protein
MLHNNLKNHQNGFTLLELLVGMVIVTIGLTTALPSYIRNMRQGNVDRYTQQLEAGFFWTSRKIRPTENKLHPTV